jgi:hypothetical protein
MNDEIADEIRSRAAPFAQGDTNQIGGIPRT